MTLQIECFVEKSVPNRVMKGLKDSINVVQVTKKSIFSQQSDFSFVFLNTSSTKLSEKVSINTIYFENQIIGC